MTAASFHIHLLQILPDMFGVFGNIETSPADVSVFVVCEPFHGRRPIPEPERLSGRRLDESFLTGRWLVI